MLKQCHLHHPPVITILSVVYINHSEWVVYCSFTNMISYSLTSWYPAENVCRKKRSTKPEFLGHQPCSLCFIHQLLPETG